MKKFLEEYSEKPTKFFKRIFFLYLFGYLPFLILQVVLNALYIMPVNIDDEEVYGVTGVLVIIFSAPVLIFLFAFITWINFSIGIIFMKLLKKMLYA